jgi:pimeloyl-ACP methyl ester carboxylesterase
MRHLETGRGVPLIHLQEGGQPRLTRAHEILARRCRVVAFEASTSDQPASAIAEAIESLGIDSFNLMASGAASATALSLALQQPERVLALVLEAPTAIRPDARDPALERRLPSLAAPTLVLFGTRDLEVPPAMGRLYKELIAGSHLVFVYDAAHAIGAERPEAFAEVVADFLERHEAFVISRAATVIHP